jgi:hypothetical protein
VETEETLLVDKHFAQRLENKEEIKNLFAMANRIFLSSFDIILPNTSSDRYSICRFIMF